MLQGFVEMGPIEKLQVIVIFVACLYQIIWFVRQTNMRVNVVAFCEQIRKLIDAGNPERALKLCAAAPHAPVALLAKLGLEARARGENARDAMRAAYPRFLSASRGGLLIAVVLGAIAFAEGVVLLAEEGVANVASIPLLFVVLLGALNASRYVAWPRELTLVCDKLG